MVTANVCAVPLPQSFEGVTLILPDEVPTDTVILFVFCPAVIVQPEGTVHVKVTPETFITEYVCPVAPWHWLLLPVIVDG